jgi:hypothetical protein
MSNRIRPFQNPFVKWFSIVLKVSQRPMIGSVTSSIIQLTEGLFQIKEPSHHSFIKIDCDI